MLIMYALIFPPSRKMRAGPPAHMLKLTFALGVVVIAPVETQQMASSCRFDMFEGSENTGERQPPAEMYSLTCVDYTN